MRNDRESARPLLLEALALSSEFSDVGAEYTFYNGLGWSMHESDPQQAMVHYRSAVAVVPSPAQHAQTNLATLLIAHGELTEAIDVYKQMYESFPPSARELFNLAKMQLDDAQHREALESLRAAQRDPSLDADNWKLSYYYMGQVHMQLHEWREASAAFAHMVHKGLVELEQTMGCDEWRLVEGWENGPGVTVTELPVPGGGELAFTDPITRRVYRDSEREYRLIRLDDVHLDGVKHDRLHHRAPQCTIYLGDVSASSMPHPGWGTAEPETGRPPMHVSQPTVVLFDNMGKHFGFYHLQTDVLSRVLFFLRDVYDPEDEMWAEASFLAPPAAMLFLDELRGSARAAALGVHVPERERFLPLAQSYFFEQMYMVDWTPPIEHDAVVRVGSQSLRAFSDPLYGLHLPPAALLRLQHELSRPEPDEAACGEEEDSEDLLDLSPTAKHSKPVASAPAREVAPGSIVWLSRKHSAERSVVGEDLLLDALRAAFGSAAVAVFGRDDVPGSSQQYDLGRARRVFGGASVVIGPHGAAFVNVLFTDKAAMVMLPLCDAVGCPSAQDTYFSYVAAALGVEMVVPQAPVSKSMYTNFTVEEDTGQIEDIVTIVRDLLRKRTAS